MRGKIEKRFSNSFFEFSFPIFDNYFRWFFRAIGRKKFWIFRSIINFLNEWTKWKSSGGIIVNLRGGELEKRIFEIKEITVSRTLGRGEELYYYAQFGFDLAKEYLSRGFHWKNLSFPPSTENFLPSVSFHRHREESSSIGYIISISSTISSRSNLAKRFANVADRRWIRGRVNSDNRAVFNERKRPRRPGLERGWNGIHRTCNFSFFPPPPSLHKFSLPLSRNRETQIRTVTQKEELKNFLIF